MKSAIARGIMDRVWPWLIGGCAGPVPFGHLGKMKGIADVWCRRLVLLHEFYLTDNKIAWCESLPWIGKITKYHLAKNLGVDCAKPDRWLVRLAEAGGCSVDQLCARLAAETGDRIATVDVVLWRACAIGVLTVRDGRIETHLA